MSTDLEKQCPFWAVVLSDLVDFSKDSITAEAGDIVRVLSAECEEDGTIDYYIAELEDRNMRFPVEPADIQRLCDVCEEAPATTEARWHHAMLCNACFALEPEIVAEAAAMLAEPAPQGSLPWHIEEA